MFPQFSRASQFCPFEIWILESKLGPYYKFGTIFKISRPKKEQSIWSMPFYLKIAKSHKFGAKQSSICSTNFLKFEISNSTSAKPLNTYTVLQKMEWNNLFSSVSGVSFPII